MNNDKVGNFIKELRLEKGLTQKELADKLYITSMAVSKWERGLSCPDISLLDDLSKILDVSIIEILRGERVSDKEYTNNKDIIDSMNYAKNKYIDFVNKLFVLIVVLISVFLCVKNLKLLFYEKKSYESVVMKCEKHDDMLSKMNLIMNNQGRYTEEEYEDIKSYVLGIRYYVDIEVGKEYCNKENYLITDIKNIIEDNDFKTMYGFDSSSMTSSIRIYDYILKYDISKLNNYKRFEAYKELHYNLYEGYVSHLKNLYLYEKDYNMYSGLRITSIYDVKYLAYDLIVDDIIKAGDIHE